MESAPLKLREATLADADAVACLLRSVTGVWQADWRPDCVCRALAAAEGLAFVALDEGEVIGFVSGHDLGFRAYLSEFVVAESHQRSGIGTGLLRALESALLRRGCRLVVADVYPPAEAFYRASGWASPAAVLLSHRPQA